MVLIIAILIALALSPKPPLLDGIPFSPCVFDRNGELLRLGVARDDGVRVFVPLREISPTMVEATLLHEDRYFRFHFGVNPVALGRAVWNAVTRTGPRIGASTITMQLARIRYRMTTRTWKGKLAQIWRALQLEWHYSKNEILEAYFNLAPYGGNVEGVGAASLIYFEKLPRQLTLPEALTLAVIPQTPSHRGPDPPQNRAALFAARGRLFDEWLSRHPEDERHRVAVELALQVRTHRRMPFEAPHLVEELIPLAGGQGPLRTTLDLRRQHDVEAVMADYLATRRKDGVRNAAALLIDYRTMETLAAVGSANYRDPSIQGQVNGMRMRRSPGSTLKPFVYGLAMDEGLIHPMSLLKDTPMSFVEYNPENFDRHFAGPIFAHNALVQSRNVPAVWLASQLKRKTLHRLLQEGGVRNLHEEKSYGLTIALGGAEVSMEELVQLYAMLANRGRWRPLRKILAENKTGSMDHPDADPVLLSPESCFLALQMLKEASRPDVLTASQSRRHEEPVYWKTGTSFSYRDAWTVGVFDRYVLAVWVGNFNGQSNAALVGRTAAAPLFFRIVENLRAVEKESDPFTPSLESTRGLQVKLVDICPVSGQVTGPHCPHDVKGWFIPGVSPIQACQVHREVVVDAQTGLRVSRWDDPAKIRREVYEFWPSDLLACFAQAGIPRRVPPPFAADCPLDRRVIGGMGPEILSPRKGMTYHLRANADRHDTLALRACADGGVKKLYWFADRTFLGSAAPGDTLYWKATPGAFVLHAVDEQGRSDSQPVAVTMVE